MTQTLCHLCSFSRRAFSRDVKRCFANKQHRRAFSIRVLANDSDDENNHHGDILQRVFSQKFISDEEDVQLFECGKTISGREFADAISRNNPDALGKKKKNEPKLSKSVSGRALSSLNIALSALLENERYQEVEKMFRIWRDEFERVEVDVVSVS